MSICLKNSNSNCEQKKIIYSLVFDLKQLNNYKNSRVHPNLLSIYSMPKAYALSSTLI